MRFAIVALVGCWRGSSPAPEPIATEPPRHAPAAAAEPVDEEEPPPPDAMTIVVSSPMPSCPSGIGFTARVVGLHISGANTVITIGRGSAHGVATTWTVELSTTPPTPATIIRIDNNTTMAQLTVPASVVQASPQVVLCAP